METNLSLEERKRLLLDRLEVLQKGKISESIFTYPCRDGVKLMIDTKLNKAFHGILAGEFITTHCWGDSLNLCVGICNRPDAAYKGQQVLYFLIEGNNGLSGFEFDGRGLTSFNELKQYATAVFV